MLAKRKFFTLMILLGLSTAGAWALTTAARAQTEAPASGETNLKQVPQATQPTDESVSDGSGDSDADVPPPSKTRLRASRKKSSPTASPSSDDDSSKEKLEVDPD